MRIPKAFAFHSTRASGLLLALLCLPCPALHAAWPPPLPGELGLSVRNDSVVARSNEMVRGGVPLPRSLDLRNTNGMAIVDSGGSPLPASFRILARWHAALGDGNAPIQWLLVRFPATVPAQSTRTFRLRYDGGVTNPAPAQALQLSQVGNEITVDTGVATFVFGGDAGVVFQRIDRSGAVTLANGGSLSSTIGGIAAGGFTSLRRIAIEQQDALSATVIVEGSYAHAALGGGLITGGRRLSFSAGSPAVGVREWLDWEGSRCGLGTIECDGSVNAQALTGWRVEIAPTLTGARSVALKAMPALAAVAVPAGAGSSAELRQLRRAERSLAQQYELNLPGQAPQTGARAESAAIVLSGNEGVLGVALKDMANFEPQALRLLSSGALAIDLADDGVWLGARQGVYAEYRVGAFATGSTAEAISAELWPALNRPLLALVDPQWIAASRATDEFPIGALPPALAAYDSTLADLMTRTISDRRSRGLEGLMTFGLFPRTWGNPSFSDEIDCGGNDPTPGDDWDDPYWCATWTDYHNAAANAVVAAWRQQDPGPLHDLAFPAALRQLHTQMQRCAPGDALFYCGQLPAGYGGYRADFNSSHAYLDNLLLSYWMSGDRTIVERLQRGASSMRDYLCPGRGAPIPGPVCAPTEPITDEYASINDRVASQWYQVFRFVGLTSGDASYLADWSSNSARFLSQNFALVQSNGAMLGFTETSGGGDTSIISGPGTYFTTQLWMASLYDFHVLYRLELDTLDAPLGIPAIAPSSARHGWARSLHRVANSAPGNGSATGVWPNLVRYSFAGSRIGGSLTQLEPGWAPGAMPDPCLDDCLYDTGKGTLTAALVRSGDELGDASLTALGSDLVQYTLQVIATTPQPLGKNSAEMFGRLHAAVARLAAASGDLIFANGFD